ncbi:MAG TPA: ABC transporter permease [bacterium]|nr:ABC transporter permease [bacterium]
MSKHSRLRTLRALCLARVREYYREPEVIFWSFVFPVLLAAALAVAFRERAPEPSRVLVVHAPGAEQLLPALAVSPLLQAAGATETAAAQALVMGRADVVVVPAADTAAGLTYRYDPTRPEASIARARCDDAIQRAAGRVDPVASRDALVSEPGGRYIDFLVPGLIGMNLLSAGMWGVGFVLVDMRIKKLLKRLLATPLRPADFLAAQLVTRLAFAVVEIGVLFAFAALVLDVPVRGSLTAVMGVALLGALAFAGLGLLVASRARKIETVSGLMNLVTMPMLVGSGVFFSVERFPAAVQPWLRLLPLTALNDALRAIALEGAPLLTQWPQLLVITVWGAASFVIGLRLFRWD